MADDQAAINNRRDEPSFQSSSEGIAQGLSSQNFPMFDIKGSLGSSQTPILVASNGETCLSHLTSAGHYSRFFQRLQSHAAVSLELKITQECLKRYVSALNFVKKLKTNAEHEMARLDSVHRQGSTLKYKGLDVEYYNKLCKEAMLHFSHWEMLEIKSKRQPCSLRQSLAILGRLECFKDRFLSLKRQNLFWLRQIGLAGLRAMANASFKQLSSTADLQNFLQGMESFNHLFSSCLRMCDQRQCFYGAPNEKQCLKVFFGIGGLTSLNIVEILTLVCVERSHLLARLVHEHFKKEAKAIELQDFLSITRFSWSFESHLSTSDLLECTTNVSYGKLQGIIRKYSQKDEEFTKQLVNTALVCSYFHHEQEQMKSDEPCERHLQLTSCECISSLKCQTCQENDNSIKAITDGTEYAFEHWELPESDSAVPHVNNERRSLFMESNQTTLKGQLCSIYADDLWTQFAPQFYNCLQSMQWPYAKDSPIGPVCCWSTAVLMGITQHLDNLASSGPFLEIGVQSVRMVSRSLYLNSVLGNLDSLHCLVIAVGQTDKCKCTTIAEGSPSTKTASLMVQVCTVFQHFFSSASHWKEFKLEETSLSKKTLSNTLSLRIEDVLDRFSAFLNYCIFWFTTKSKAFLASWNLPAFFVVTQCELCILMKSVNAALQLMEDLSSQIGNIYSSVDVKQLWGEMETKAGYLQVTEAQSWESFKEKLIVMASEFWNEMMPKGRIWKRSRNSNSVLCLGLCGSKVARFCQLQETEGNLPTEPSSYVEHAIVQILQPIIEGTNQLPVGLQNDILTQAVEIIMDTWSSHILKEGIKFSVLGAYQLQVDFNYVKLWLTSETSTLNSTIQSDLAILDVFHQLNEAVRLLMIQPKKRYRTKKPTENGVEQDMISNTSSISGSSTLSTNSSYDGELERFNHRLIPNKEQWLNLRLRKGKSSFPLVIPACLKSAEQTQ